MNVFFLGTDPIKAAQYHCNTHLVKMLLETCQLLSFAHHVLDAENAPPDIYKPTHKNHPCAVWVRETSANYAWTYRLYRALLDEYTYRYDKIHASSRLIPLLSQQPKNIRRSVMTPPALAMPDEFKHADPVTAYRNYYRTGKAHLLKHTRRSAPDWL